MSLDGKTASFEVKSYDLTANSPSKLVNNIVKQVLERADNLPKGMTQKVAIDITGQTVTSEKQTAIRDAIVKKSGSQVVFANVEFLEREIGQ